MKNNKNIYEELIDQIVLEEVSNGNLALKEKLDGLPLRQKRKGLLSVLDKDRNLISRLDKDFKEDYYYTKDKHLQEVLLLLRDYVNVKEVEKKKFGEVMTPISLVEDMLDTLPDEVWSNPDLKWLDPANGIGIFPSVIVERLLKGLESYEPDIEKRYKHIMENMIYVCELQPKNLFIHLYAFDTFDENELNVYHGSFLEEGFDNHMRDVWGVEKFDIIVGNPPYQTMDNGHGASSKPLYNTFVNKCIKICDKLVFITPSRWMKGGKGLDKYRNKMLNRSDIKIIKHYDNSQDVFGKSVDIKGGVQYFLIDKEYKGKTIYNNTECILSQYDIFVEPKYHNLIEKFKKERKLSDIYKGRGDSLYKIQTNDKRFSNLKQNNCFVKTFVSKQKGFVKFIDSNLLDKHNNDFMLITTRASGSSGNLGFFGNKFIGFPNEFFSGSYIGFIINNIEEAESILSYLNTRFADFMLSLKKITQDISKKTCEWIPLPPLDRLWDDEKIYKYYDLTKDDIRLIKE